MHTLVCYACTPSHMYKSMQSACFSVDSRVVKTQHSLGAWRPLLQSPYLLRSSGSPAWQAVGRIQYPLLQSRGPSALPHFQKSQRRFPELKPSSSSDLCPTDDSEIPATLTGPGKKVPGMADHRTQSPLSPGRTLDPGKP
jgi:hypothetical protein